MSSGIGHRVTGPVTGPVLVLIGSLGTDLTMWDPQVSDLSSDHRIVAVDLPGHGETPVQQTTVAGFADQVLGLLDELSIDRFSVVGLSFGGAVAQVIAAHSDRVDRLVLSCTAVQFASAADFWRSRAAAVRAQGLGDIVPISAERWFTARFDSPERDRLLATLGELAPEGYATCCDALAVFDARDSARAITAPTLVIAAGHDQATPVARAEELTTAIPGAQLAVIAEAAHLANVECAEAFTRLVRRHLAGQAPS